MKINKLIGLLVVFALIVPMASAGTIGNETDRDNEDLPQEKEFATRAAYTITQGQTNYHGYYVAPGTSTLSVDLNWFTDDYSLKLGVFRPDGSLYGYYYDDEVDYLKGRIYLTINNPASGFWTFTVYGEDVAGTWPYVINVG